jgi:uncharacterized membrane protein
MLLLSGWAWMQVPADQKIPVHWGLSGKPDRFGGKFEGLFLLPLMTIGLIALFALIPRIEPRKLNLERSRRAYIAIWTGVLGMMAVVHALVVLSALGRDVAVSIIVPVIIGVLMMITGNYLGKVRSNFFVGVRTPWTLSSELSWNKSNRLGGWLFVIWGLVIVLSAVIGKPSLTYRVILAGAGVLIVVTTLYSYLVWKADPDKQATGR